LQGAREELPGAERVNASMRSSSSLASSKHSQLAITDGGLAVVQVWNFERHGNFLSFGSNLVDEIAVSTKRHENPKLSEFCFALLPFSRDTFFGR